MWTTYEVFIEFVTILLQFYIMVFWSWSIWDLSFLTRDRTHTHYIGRWSLNHWSSRGFPYPVIFILIHGRLEKMWYWRTRDKGQAVPKKGTKQSENTSEKQEDSFEPASWERCHPRGKSISSSTRRCLQKSHVISYVYSPKLTVRTLCCLYYLQVITSVVF